MSSLGRIPVPAASSKREASELTTMQSAALYCKSQRRTGAYKTRYGAIYRHEQGAPLRKRKKPIHIKETLSETKESYSRALMGEVLLTVRMPASLEKAAGVIFSRPTGDRELPALLVLPPPVVMSAAWAGAAAG